jgi:CDGSH-type Zn-finger protein
LKSKDNKIAKMGLRYMDNSEEKKKPVIVPTPNGPYLVKDLDNLKNSRGEAIETKPTMVLCRCGGSNNKPFCDGTHARIGFSGAKVEGRVPDKMDNYEGREITIHDNRGVCSHAGFCTDNVPNVWRMGKEPWINPDGADPVQIEAVIKLCPSGALSCTRKGVLIKDFDRKPGITVSKDGPYRVVGGPGLNDQGGNKPESKEHFALCRCGGSKNKPFCDGTHWHIKFKDDKN